MKTKSPLLFIMVCALLSCHKQKYYTPGTPANPHSFVSLKLKDITIASLPSPYYHFEYSYDKHISGFNFSNGLIYDMHYTGDNLTLMKNNTDGTNKDSINYNYTGTELTGITVFAEGGVMYRRAFLTYYSSGQLQKLEWELTQDDASFAKEQSYTYTYYPDGNIKEIFQEYFTINTLPATSFTDRYENYDDKKNADGFILAEPTRFPLPILLPGITLQVNNASRIVRTGGAAVTYEVNYTYTYDGSGRPLTKTGDFVNTNGANAGQHYQLQTTYSYYN